MVRTFKINSFSNFQIYNTVLWTVVTCYTLHARTYLSYNWKFVPFDHLYPFCPPCPRPWNWDISFDGHGRPVLQGRQHECYYWHCTRRGSQGSKMRSVRALLITVGWDFAAAVLLTPGPLLVWITRLCWHFTCSEGPSLPLNWISLSRSLRHSLSLPCLMPSLSLPPYVIEGIFSFICWFSPPEYKLHGLYLFCLHLEFRHLKQFLSHHRYSINTCWALPWWRSGWESACQCRGHGFEPWSGKIPHAAERLGPWATIAEPARLEPVLRNGRGRDGERPAHHDEEWSPLATAGESPRTEAKTQHSHK